MTASRSRSEMTVMHESTPFEPRGRRVVCHRGGAPDKTWVEYDRRGEPKGTSERWCFERLVPPLYGKRRVREQVQLAYCADGWWSNSGSAERPMGDAICDGFFRVREEDHMISYTTDEAHRGCPVTAACPVVWRVTVRRRRERWTKWYCDPELPEEYRVVAREECDG